MSVLEKATALVAGVVDKNAEFTRIDGLLAELRATGWQNRLKPAHAHFMDLIATSHDLSEIRAARDAREASKSDDDAFVEIQEKLQRARDDVKAQRTLQTEEGIAPALEYLHGELSKLMTRVRKLDRDLGPVTSIEAAIRDDDLIVLWREVEESADVYEEIRTAQVRIVGMLEGDPYEKRNLIERAGRLVNPFDHDPAWIERRKVKQPTSTADEAYREWVENPPRARWEWEPGQTWPTDVDRIAALRWIAKNTAVWVPTIAQMRTLLADLEAMNGPLPTLAHIRHAYDAYDRYYTRRGMKPARPFDVTAARAVLPAPRGQRDTRDAEGRPHADPRVLALIGE